MPSDDQDREFIEPDRDRSFPAQIMKQVEQPLTQHRATQHRVVRSGNADARDFHDLLAEWLLALVELVHRELWKAPFFAGRRLRERHGRQPPAAATASDDIQTANFMISSMFSL